MANSIDKIGWLKIALTPGIGPGLFYNLIDRFGDPEGILGRSEAELRTIDRLKTGTIRSLLQTSEGKRDEEANRELEAMEEKGVRAVTIGDPDFPRNLLEIPTPPPLLFVRGSIEPEDSNAIAIVGTRRCDSYGLKMTRMIAADLVAHGIAILSGLALGIDGAAHQAALNSGGRTWGFLASGLGQMYPPENAGLAEEIAERGAVITEFTMKEKALRGHFPSRNRLISGASLGVLVVQAPKKSGALITARYAMEQNREVFALPGRVDERTSEGPHQLIQDGAKLVHDVGDILEEIGSRTAFYRRAACDGVPVAENKPARSAKASKARFEKAEPRKTESASPGRRFEDLEPDDRRIALRLEAGPVHVDRLAADLDLPVRKVSERLLHLEMKGVVLRLPGMSFDLA